MNLNLWICIWSLIANWNIIVITLNLNLVLMLNLNWLIIRVIFIVQTEIITGKNCCQMISTVSTNSARPFLRCFCSSLSNLSHSATRFSPLLHYRHLSIPDDLVVSSSSQSIIIIVFKAISLCSNTHPIHLNRFSLTFSSR